MQGTSHSSDAPLGVHMRFFQGAGRTLQAQMALTGCSNQGRSKIKDLRLLARASSGFLRSLFVDFGSALRAEAGCQFADVLSSSFFSHSLLFSLVLLILSSLFLSSGCCCSCPISVLFLIYCCYDSSYSACIFFLSAARDRIKFSLM